jgi:hypothetical protein
MRTSTQRTGLVGCDIQRALLCGSLHSAGGYLGTFTTTTTKLGTTNDYIDDLCCAVIAALWVIEQYSLDLDVYLRWYIDTGQLSTWCDQAVLTIILTGSIQSPSTIPRYTKVYNPQVVLKESNYEYSHH